MQALTSIMRPGRVLTMSAMFVALGVEPFPSALRARARDTGEHPALHPNTIKYREQTYTHASNRSGVASLTGRALLGKDGNTALELTTGQLDAPGAPGDISHVQAKLLDVNQRLQSTLNFNGTTGGDQSFFVPGRPAHSWIQAQANVRDIDPRRTDVVTITERVNRRPDIAVLSVSAPEKAPTRTSLIISAAVAELNGDVGAHANCVLYVNGVAADRANGIWIADGDQVSCAFTRSFDDPGTYTLEVRADSVTPGDWDTSNNSAQRSIQIISDEVPLKGSASATWTGHVYGYKSTDQWSSASGANSASDEKVTNYTSQSASLYSYSSKVVVFPLSRLTVVQSTGGSTVSNIDVTNVSATFYGCSYTYASDGSGFAQVCPNKFNRGTNVWASHYAGVTTYYSSGFNTGWNLTDGSWNYSWNDTTGTASGKWTNIVSDYTFDIRVLGANDTMFVARPTVSLSGSSYNHDTPLTCSDSARTGYTEHYCYQSIDHGSYYWGSVSF
ncbi:MAG TPA: hypothetical protein VF159_03030 [Gemmatimonadaceae bacterium]